MKIIKATTNLKCNKCEHLKIANKDTIYKNGQRPWILICPYSGLVIETVPTSKGMEDQKLPVIHAPWDCKLRVKLRILKVEPGIQLSLNCL